MRTYSSVTRRRNCFRAAVSSGSVYFFSIGMSSRRSGGDGACNETANRNCSPRFANFARLGRMPTVETVMCRAPIPNPAGWFRIVSVVSTASQLSSGSPIPMNTTLVGCCAGSRNTISRTWPAISPAERLRRNPMRPVAQKTQPSAHPACDEMHSVRRLPSGMNTDSIASPSASAHRNFTVPSFET